MDSAVIIEPVIKKLVSFNILNKMAIVAFPLWVISKFFPQVYINLKGLIKLNLNNLSDIGKYIDKTINILVEVNYILMGITIFLIICFFIQLIISKIVCFVGGYASTENVLRKKLYKLVGELFFRIAIYIVSIGIYSDVILGYGKPLELINVTNAKFVSIIPFTLMIIVLISGMIFPDPRERS